MQRLVQRFRSERFRARPLTSTPVYLTELLPSPSHNSGHTFRKESYPVLLVKNRYASLVSATLDYSLEQPTVRTAEEFLS